MHDVQMFRIFFNNMTTSMAEMEIHLSHFPTSRNAIPTDLSAFKLLFEENEDSAFIEGPKRRRASTGSGKKKKSQTSKGNMERAAKLIEVLNWDMTKFIREWRRIHDHMPLAPFVREIRVAKGSSNLSTRLLTMSGLSWNTGSKNTTRDYGNIITATTLETALIESYRVDLLKACPGGVVLRKEMYAYLMSIANVDYERHMTTGAKKRVFYWQFPDNIPLDVGSHGGNKGYDSEKLLKELSQANDILKHSRGKPDKSRKVIEGLYKNNLLWSSEPGAPHGSIEMLAEKCILALTRVSDPF